MRVGKVRCSMKYEETVREENANWAEYWLGEYNLYSGIVPENTHTCYAGMTAGESANHAWEQYQAYSERLGEV